MRLSRRSIIEEIGSGGLMFDPQLEPSQIDVSSIDLRLGKASFSSTRNLKKKPESALTCGGMFRTLHGFLSCKNMVDRER